MDYFLKLFSHKFSTKLIFTKFKEFVNSRKLILLEQLPQNDSKITKTVDYVDYKNLIS